MAKKRIMVVEDEGITSMTIRSTLEEMGYEVPATVASGEEAVEKAIPENIDLVLMDITLKGTIDGIEASSRIRSRFNLPIVYLTAHSDEGLMEKVKKTEPFGYVVKPFSDHELRMAVEIALYKHQMEIRLKESESRFRTLFNQASDCILLLDPYYRAESVIVDANDAACEMHGYTKKEMLGRPVRFLDAPDAGPGTAERFGKLILGEKVSFEVMHKRKNGELFPVEVNAQMVMLGDKPFILAIDRDITERKNAESELQKHRENLIHMVSERTEELRNANELLEKVFSNVHVLIAYMDRDFNFIKVNRRYAEADGREPGFYCGKNHFDLFPNKENETIFRSVVETGQPYFVQAKPFEYVHNPERGTTYWDWSLIPVKDEEGTVSSLVLSLVDVTENIRLYSDLIRSEQLAYLGRLAAGVAHEVNNPINGIINYAQIIASKSGPGSREEDIARRIIVESDRIANIVSSLLSFARENRGERSSATLQEILSDSIALSGIMLKKDGIRLTLNVPDDLLVVVNKQQIEQVFLNIISNARYALNQKYPDGDDNKILEISGESIIEDRVRYARIIFQDRGAGIPEGIINRLMNPFFSTKPDGEGTGLGLSISHGIVTDHNGRLRIESREGDFTRVVIDLPGFAD
jgi:PAS domain S-box-containing protein